MKGIRDQLMVDEKYNSAGDLFPIHDADDSEHLCFDDISGAQLNGDLVKNTRADELRHSEEHGVYEIVPVEKCWKETYWCR